jgi:iron(III) transport system permease protein
VIVYIAVVSVIPIIGLAVMANVRALTTLVAPWHLWTSANWHQILSDPSVRRSIGNSLLIALVGAVASVLLVAVATLIAHRSRFALRRTLPATLMYPRAVPGIVLGIGFFWLLLMVNMPGVFLRNSVWGELLALCVRNITLAYVVIAPSLARINPEFDHAARASGAGWWRTTGGVLLPMLRPALLAAFVLMFITLLGDYDPVVFLQKPGTEVMGVTMLQIWERGAVGPIAALALIQVAIVIAVLALGARALKGVRHA